MAYKKPSYEEYCNATKYARFKYKFSTAIMFLAWLSFIFVIIWAVNNAEEVGTDPLKYGAKKYNVDCICYSAEDRTKGLGVDSQGFYKIDSFGNRVGDLTNFNLNLSNFSYDK